MFKVMLRALVSWQSGFARYLDLCFGVCLAVLAILWMNPWCAALAMLSLASFIFDFNAVVQRWTMRSAISHKMGR